MPTATSNTPPDTSCSMEIDNQDTVLVSDPKVCKSYTEALGELEDTDHFNGHGIARYPNHQFIFRYPHMQLLPDKTTFCIPPPLDHERRSEPVYNDSGTYDFSFHSYTMVDESKAKLKAARATRKLNLSETIDAISRFEGTTIAEMVTYKYGPAPGKGTLYFKISISDTYFEDGVLRRGQPALFTLTKNQFYDLHKPAGCVAKCGVKCKHECTARCKHECNASCNARCKHWWHNLEELFMRSSDRAYCEVERYAALTAGWVRDERLWEKLKSPSNSRAKQDFTLPAVTWATSPISLPTSVWQPIKEEYEHYFTTTLPAMSINPAYEDGQLTSQSKNTKGKNTKSKMRRSEISIGKITVDKVEMMPGIAHLLQLCRATFSPPYRLAPEFLNETDVMQQVLERVITFGHGWTYWPRDLADLMLREVMGALAETSVPPFKLGIETVYHLSGDMKLNVKGVVAQRDNADSVNGNNANSTSSNMVRSTDGEEVGGASDDRPEPPDVPMLRQVELAPGFNEFLVRFVTGLINWCADLDRKTVHYFFDRNQGPVRHWMDDAQQQRHAITAGQRSQLPQRKSKRQENTKKESSRVAFQADEDVEMADVHEHDFANKYVGMDDNKMMDDESEDEAMEMGDDSAENVDDQEEHLSRRPTLRPAPRRTLRWINSQV